MTNLKEWAEAVELTTEEAEDFDNAVDTLQGNERFSVEQEMDDGNVIHVIKKNGRRQKLEVKSTAAQAKMLEDIKKDYLPRKFEKK